MRGMRGKHPSQISSLIYSIAASPTLNLHIFRMLYRHFALIAQEENNKKEATPVRRWLREMAFQVTRRDLALFLEDHTEDLLHIFREEIQRLDDEIPEERSFIDIKMVPLGETILKAALRALSRFLREGDVE